MSRRQPPGRDQGIWALVFGAADVGHTWFERLYGMAKAKPTEQQLLDDLVSAKTYEDWWQAANALDDLDQRFDWRINPIDHLYDYRLLEERRKELARLRKEGNVSALTICLRQGLLRNHLNITRLALYTETYAGTKDNINRYVEESVEAIRFITESNTSTDSGSLLLTPQQKLDVIYESRKSFGSSALVLQGGSIFGLCHLGVVKALFEHGVLPKVIVGTATGALMAALVSIHTVAELPGFFEGEGLDLSAFAAASTRAQQETEAELQESETPAPHDAGGWYQTLERRAWRLIEEGFLLDPQVLNESIAANVGDVTFREAYDRTDRALNIVVSSPSEEIPTLMNYLTAPDVLIRSAAMASHITNMARMPKAGVQLLCKEPDGSIRTVDFRPSGSRARRPPTATNPRKTPLARARQQFNIDHFIISQARPYVAPFLRPSLPYVRNKATGSRSLWPSRLFSIPDLGGVIKQGLLLTDIAGCLPDSLRRVLSDELVPGDCITLVPEFNYNDYLRLLRNPTRDEVAYWMVRGEQSVWPSLAALKVRCMIEMALDRAFDQVRGKATAAKDAFPLLLAQMQARPPPLKRATNVPRLNGLATSPSSSRERVDQVDSHDGQTDDSDDEGTIGADDVGSLAH